MKLLISESYYTRGDDRDYFSVFSPTMSLRPRGQDIIAENSLFDYEDLGFSLTIFETTMYEEYGWKFSTKSPKYCGRQYTYRVYKV